jgi:hypothetical protein
MHTKSFYAYSFLKLHLHHSSKIKSCKEVTKQYGINQGFSSFFCLFIEGSGSGSGTLIETRVDIDVVSFPPLTEGAHASGTKEYLKESRDFCWSASSTHRRSSCFRHQRIYKTE